MKSKPLILAKASLTKEQIEAKENAGAEGIEIQLLDEMVVNRLDKQFCYAEAVYDLDALREKDVHVVHAPIIPGISDITLERLCDEGDAFLLEQIFFIANFYGHVHGRKTIIVVHSESYLEELIDIGGSWTNIVYYLNQMLNKYPHTEVVIENVSPLRGIGKGKALHLANNFAFDNVELVQALRQELQTDRIGTCLDTCHQMLTQKYITGLYQMVGDVPVPDLSMGTFFDKNKDYLKLIHLCDMKGSGYGRGRHGVPFNIFTAPTMNSILDLYHATGCNCPITLEVEESDYIACDGFRNTKSLVDAYYKRLITE